MIQRVCTISQTNLSRLNYTLHINNSLILNSVVFLQCASSQLSNSVFILNLYRVFLSANDNFTVKEIILLLQEYF